MKTVLIVDDDKDDITLLCTAINSIDATIKCINANNGVRALELLTDNNHLQPDYIFLDLNMPRLGGNECLLEIRNIAGLETVPVILYSTSKLKEYVAESMKMQAVYFLTKPTKLSILKIHISNILHGRWELIQA